VIIKYGKVIPILLSLCMFSHTVLAAEKEKPAPAVKQPAQQQIQTGNPSVNPITQAVVKGGALQCASRVNQVTNFLISGSQGMGAHLYVPAIEPDRKMVSVSLEIQNENVPFAFASASFAPNQANGCGAMYEAVAYWNMKCDDVASKQFTGLKKVGSLRKEIIALDGGPVVKVFLMPAGSGCVSIKKEVVQ